MTNRNEPDWPLKLDFFKPNNEWERGWNTAIDHCKAAFTEWQKKQPDKREWEDIELEFDTQFLVATSNPMTKPKQHWMANDTPTPEDIKQFIKNLMGREES